MKPAPFEYQAPATLEAALDLLARHGGDAKILAGGQSLVPLLSMRLTYPDLLVDLRRVEGLDTIFESDGHLVIGAMVRQLEAETSATVAARCPLIVKALRQVALWRMEGYTSDEIAERLGCARRTVARRLDLIRKLWTAEGAR